MPLTSACSTPVDRPVEVIINLASQEQAEAHTEGSPFAAGEQR